MNTCRGIVSFLTAAVLAVLLIARADAAQTLRESGSTLLAPLMSLWAQAYNRAHPDVAMTVEASGSAAGIDAAIAGAADVGTSDAFLTDAQSARGMINVPLAVSAQLVAYNIPEARGTHLHLSAAVIGDIYANRIAYWDDPKIAALNAPQHLPHQKIVPVRRSEGSGDTFMFTSYLSTAKSWPIAPGTTVHWPQRPSMLEARGNDAMVSVAGKTPYSIAYIAISYLDQAQTAGLDFAALQSRDGAFVLPSRETMNAAVNGAPMNADGRVSLIARPGANAYPIVTYEYAIVREQQGDAKKAETLKNFLSWAINSNGGNSLERFLSDLNFVPLPDTARSVAMGLIDRIK